MYGYHTRETLEMTLFPVWSVDFCIEIKKETNYYSTITNYL